MQNLWMKANKPEEKLYLRRNQITGEVEESEDGNFWSPLATQKHFDYAAYLGWVKE